MNSNSNYRGNNNYASGGGGGGGESRYGGSGNGGYGGGYGHGMNDKKQHRRVAQEELTQKKMEKETEYFWTLVERNKKQGIRRMIPGSGSSEEKKLFGSQGNAGIKFDSYDSIPVEKSGPHADAAAPMNSFTELTDSLPEFMTENLQRMKYDVPTPIQKYAIPLALLGHDLMCSAQTGSGKTCAFLFPMMTSLTTFISSLDPSPEFCRHQFSIDEQGVHPLAVVLAPTRELAAQIHLESRKICFGSQLRSLVLYGGSDIRSQLSELSYGCDIIIATPGRMIDIIDRGIISLSEVKCLILDEADRMLDMGFEPQIREIVQFRDMPGKEDRQTLMFSATFKPDIQKLASEFLVEYVWIGVGRVGSTVENIKQSIVLSTPDSNVKLQLTVDAINSVPGRTLIFVQMKRTAAWLSDVLRNEYQIRVDDIHSDKSQVQREASLRRFRDGQVRVLVGTDVAARGLDIPDVSHVIQYDLPHTPDEFDSYVHRVGRTGRAGHVGQATSLFVPGTDAGGNSRIAPLILRLLEETEQEIPEWFRSMAQQRMPSGGGGNSRGRKTWGNGNGGRNGGRGGGGGGVNYRGGNGGNGSQQYNAYQSYGNSSYHPGATAAMGSYEDYDYGSGYVGDYRYSSYASAMERAVPQYYEPPSRPAAVEYSATTTSYGGAAATAASSRGAYQSNASSLPLPLPPQKSHLLQPPAASPATNAVSASTVPTAAAAGDSGEAPVSAVNPDPEKQGTASAQRTNIQRSHEPHDQAYAHRVHSSDPQGAAQYYDHGVHSPQLLQQQSVAAGMEYYAPRSSLPMGLPPQSYYPSPEGYAMGQQQGYAPNWRPQQVITITHTQPSLYPPSALPLPVAAGSSPYHHLAAAAPQGHRQQGYPDYPDPSRGYQAHPSSSGSGRGYPHGGEYGSPNPNVPGYPSSSYPSYY